MSPSNNTLLRIIPPMNDLLEHQIVQLQMEQYGREKVIGYIKESIEELRKILQRGEKQSAPSKEELMSQIIQNLGELLEKNELHKLKKVINATGIILHTNLGRAPLPKEALDSIINISEGYANLEFDLEKGIRGSRYSHIESILTEITGAESAMVVNNNAAAVFLAMNTLAQDREVVISRGQQVEIGGSFRIPDIITGSGAKMIEVGTTNKTHLNDYEQVINESTALLLKVHTSNFRVIGFTKEVPLSEMVELGRKHHLYTIEDLGSGSLLDLCPFGLPYEPTVQESIKKGVDLVTFSGDKLLGGPQAGIIAGRKALIDQIKKNPLTRMVRSDKMTIAALEAVLNLYRTPEKAMERIPVLKMLHKTLEQLQKDAEELCAIMDDFIKKECEVEIVDQQDETGGGSFPGACLQGKAVALKPYKGNVNRIYQKMRIFTPPVIGSINKDRIILSMRTIPKKDYRAVVECIRSAVEGE